MGHFLSRAIKRFTQCSNNTRNQLADSNQTDAASHDQHVASERNQDLVRPSSESIPVGQSIDSAEYAAFKTAPSSIDKNHKDNLPSTSHDNKRTESLAESNRDYNQANERGPNSVGDELMAQNRPQVEEAVIKIQALVRGHLTRKALKDAHQQAVPLNVLGQSQFDEESLRNPPNVLFSSTSQSASDNHQPMGGKSGNGRSPPLKSIAEDEELTSAVASSTRVKRRLSSPKSRTANSASETSGESVESQSTSPSNEANASIDIHCDLPTSASIDIMDHSSRPLADMASVLHTQSAANPLAGAESTATVAADRSDQPAGVVNSVNNVELQNGSGLLGSPMAMLLNDHPMSVSSVPSTPPHINLALTTNSHSIDSAEAAAIRIQSAFRGYHTRKHSPYRRRSPGDAGSSPSALTNGGSSNGQPKRSILRQQNATILDDEESASGRGQEVANESLISSEESEESRQSRLRRRLDEARTSDLPLELSDRADAPTSLAELNSIDDDQITMTTRGVQPGPSDLSANITNQAEPDSAELDLQLHDRLLPAKSDRRNEAFSLDTDSSNLGAALSLNEDLSEGLSHASMVGDAQPVSLKRDSLGAALESSGDDSSASQDPVLREQAVKKQLEELDRVTDQLEAALDEVTDNEALTYGDEVTSSVTRERLADETQQNLNELESDDVERRHPSGFVDVTQHSQNQEQQAALVASNSYEDQEMENRNEQQLAQLDIPQARLDAISPDEAIGSGGSSPALVESHDGNSTDNGGDSDQDQDGQQEDGGATRADNQQSGSGQNRGGKKKRNRRRGKK